MTARHPLPATECLLHCDHCGRPVRETQHTRSGYRVDYYSVHSGHGEVCTLAGDDRHAGMTYVRLLDRFDVVTCVDCYARVAVQNERERRFHPEREMTVDGEAT